MPKHTMIRTAALLSLVLPPGWADAQARVLTQSRLAVTAGVATDQRGMRSNALSLAPTLDVTAGAGVALQLAGNATRFASTWSMGAGGAVALRHALAPHLALTLDGAANVSRLSGEAHGSFAAAELLPALELRAGALSLFGGARAAGGRTSRPALAPAAPPVIGGGGTRSRTEGRSAAGPLFGAALSLVGKDGPALRLSAREDRLAYEGGQVTDRTLAVAATQDALTLSASGTARTSPAEAGTFGSVAMSWRLSPDVSLDAAAGRYAGNVVLATPAGRFVSVGLGVRLGAASEPGLPRAAGAPAPRAGTTRLALRAPDARRVEVAGDFTDWKFVAAVRAANGVWYADIRIPPGQYRYAFRIDGTRWRVPDGATAVDDGFGGTSAWITVPGR